MFTEAERQALDPDGLFRKFYEKHVKDGKIEVPALSSYTDRDHANRFTNWLCDVATVCMLYGDTENAKQALLLGHARFQGIRITGMNAFGESECICTYASSFHWFAARFGLAEVAQACLYVMCPSYSKWDAVAVTRQAKQVSTPEEAVQYVKEELADNKKYRLAKYLDE